jgi:diguanylate cyclase (GGDEF)-like protein
VALDEGFGPSPGRMAVFILALQVLLVVVFIVTAQLAVALIDRADTGSERVRAERMLHELASDTTPMPAGEIGRLLDLGNARFGAASEIGKGEIGVPLPAALSSGKAEQFIWTPRRLGSIAWRHLAPFRMSLAGLMLVLMAVLLWRFRNLTNELERRRHRARELARRDSLTGLYNRFGFEQRLAAELDGARPFALCYLDLDGFKKVNDRLGHAAGDALLRLVAGRLGDLVGPSDFVARLGGDEFAILLAGVGSDDNARQLAERLYVALSQPHLIGDEIVSVPASIGVTLAPAQASTTAQLLANADAALYAAKDRRREKVVLYEPPANLVQLSA